MAPLCRRLPRAASFGKRRMLGAVIASLVVLAASCKRSAPAAEDARSRGAWEGCGLCQCDLEPVANCAAGHLPRVTEKNWTPAVFEQMATLSVEGTVAVDHMGDETRLVPACRLDGTYTEVQGESGSGRLWATDRVFFKLGELGTECETATHAVAAFAVVGLPARPSAKGTGQAAALSGRASLRFSAVLVPLPCPPTVDLAPARGCVGRGLTGPERRKRAFDLWDKDGAEGHKDDLAYRFEVSVLMPDERRGIGYLGSMQSIDCFLGFQIEFSTTKEPPAKWPRFDPDNSESCINQPPFLTCFPGLFDPAPGVVSCWRPAAS